MWNKVLGILFIVFLGINFGGAVHSGCSPNYVCEEWGDCVDEFQQRTCVDENCGRRDIVERRICIDGVAGCKPKVVCDEWERCVYTDKTNDLFEGEISFGGYQTRNCRDENGCVDAFMEERYCEEHFELNLVEREECGRRYLFALDSSSGNSIAKISLDSWREKDKFDIVFTNGENVYCPECFNGIKDNSEEGIDCGGDCKACLTENGFSFSTLGKIFSWGAFFLFAILTIREILGTREEGLRKDFNKRKSRRKI